VVYCIQNVCSRQTGLYRCSSFNFFCDVSATITTCATRLRTPNKGHGISPSTVCALNRMNSATGPLSANRTSSSQGSPLSKRLGLKQYGIVRNPSSLKEMNCGRDTTRFIPCVLYSRQLVERFKLTYYRNATVLPAIIRYEARYLGLSQASNGLPYSTRRATDPTKILTWDRLYRRRRDLQPCP
jgi:hypothetical protein